jgi:2-amino-4-hydroxy-6-hydroxymethyldihydropteridine diphosphokinase
MPQADYVNTVAGMLTRLSPAALLRELLRIEREQGRDRSSGERWGPRRIDLDILVYGTRLIDRADLRIPHPSIFQRNFVLFPLLEIAPSLVIPGQGEVRILAEASDRAALEKIEAR